MPRMAQVCMKPWGKVLKLKEDVLNMNREMIKCQDFCFFRSSIFNPPLATSATKEQSGIFVRARHFISPHVTFGMDATSRLSLPNAVLLIKQL